MPRKRKLKYGNILITILVTALIIYGGFNLAKWIFYKLIPEDPAHVQADEVMRTKLSTESDPLTAEVTTAPSDMVTSSVQNINATKSLDASFDAIIKVGTPLEKAIDDLEQQGIAYRVLTQFINPARKGIVGVKNEQGEIVLYNEMSLTTEKVHWLQENLKIAGYYTFIDGSFGPATKEVMDRYTQDQLGVIYDNFNSEIESSLITFNQNRLAGDINDYLVLVNKAKNLGSSDIPVNLVPITVNHMPHVKQIEKETNDQLNKMFNAAKQEGITLRVVSGYRSFDYQVQLFANYAANSGFEKANTYSALPGQSEHQTGLVVDIDDGNAQHTLKQSFDQTKAYQWLSEHAFEYGFILSYPKHKEAESGYMYEPWHYRYVGSAEVAKEIHDKQILLADYLNER